MDDDRLLSTAEVAAHLGVSLRQAQALITRGRIRAVKVGRSYVVRAGDLKAYRPRPAHRPARALST